jgi:hypothetical protein
MAVEVFQRLVEGQRAVVNLDGDFEVQEAYLVQGLDQTDQNTLGQALVIDLADGIPPMGTEHDAYALTVSQHEVQMLTRDQARVVVTYSKPDLVVGGAARFFMEGGQQVNRRHEDVFLSPITTKRIDEFGQVTNEDEAHWVDSGVPQTALRWQFAIDTNPVPLSTTYLNRVNSDSIWGFGINELLCTRVSSEQRRLSEGGGFVVDMLFQQSLNLWKATVVSTEPATGQPFNNPAPGVTQNEYVLYDEIAFATLANQYGLILPP